ncbi:cytochrome c oxidase subunit II [Pollutimonas subterranea]|uniref:cytochrome c oxidase subunit II n=1 Tax=Pollutimonas subterranea TaxID=2045210 RepID=UPI00130451D5|nr:cytochrome c oxidase subunit II [Pollutimonas subterranea]
MLLVPLLAGCSQGRLSALDAAGPAARDIAQVWNVMAWGAAAILVFMVALTVYAACRSPGKRRGTPTMLLLIGGGLVFPGVVLIALLGYGWNAGDEQAPRRGESNVFRVEVRAHQWWWEIIYPEADNGPLYAVNQIHVPAGRPVYVTVTSSDVIHSFWVPRLGGKIDAIPGRSNTIRLMASEPGTYDGVCAEFCGIGHAHMPLNVRAHDEAGLAQALAGLSTVRAVP